MSAWQCGDCGAVYPKSVYYCARPLDDYLSLRGGSIESAINRAVEDAIAPIVKRADDRLRGITYWRTNHTIAWRWAS